MLAEKSTEIQPMCIDSGILSCCSACISAIGEASLFRSIVSIEEVILCTNFWRSRF